MVATDCTKPSSSSKQTYDLAGTAPRMLCTSQSCQERIALPSGLSKETREDASLLRQDFKRRRASQYSLERSPRDHNPAAQGSVPCPRPLGNVDFRQRGGGQTSHRVYISIEITIATIRPRLLEVGSLRVA